MEFKEYLGPLRKWWWLIVLSAIVAGSSSYLVASRQPEIYRARATLMIGRAIDDPNPSGSEFWLTQQLAQTYAEIATRDTVRLAAAEALGLSNLPEYSVQAVADTQLLEAVVTDTSPERAQAVANEIMRQIIRQSPTTTEQEEESRLTFINAQLDELETNITATQEEIAELQLELASMFSAREIADTQAQINGLQNKVLTLQSIFGNLLANTQGGAINTLHVIEPASLPTVPVGPSTSATVMVAAAIGAVLAAAAAYMIEFLDDSISSPTDIAKITSVPTLAGIAKIEGEDDATKLVTISQPRSPTSEAYRVLRTGIQFSSVDKPKHAAFMITSANPSEGKSLSIANLAVVMAQAGNNVLVVDADLRRPIQHKLFNLSQNEGLTSFFLDFNLSDSDAATLALLKRVISQTTVPGLHVLPSGPIPPNPSELLGSEKMAATMETLTSEYDYVLIDSPPVLAVTDAVVLSRITSGVILIVDSNHTRKSQLRQAIQHLNGGQAHILGIVLNRLTPKSDGYYAYYYYRSTYLTEPTDRDGKGQPTSNGSKRIRRKKVKQSGRELQR